MISTIQIISIFTSAFIIIGIPFYIFRKYRGKPQLNQGLIWGMLTFLLYTIVRMILLTLLSNVLPEGLLTNSMTFDGNMAIAALMEGIINAFSFTLAAIVVYKFQLKKMKNDDIPLLNSLTFVMMSAIFLIMPLINYGMFSIAINKGNLEQFVREDVSIEEIKAMAEAVKQTPAALYLDMGLARIFDILVYTASFALLYKGLAPHIALKQSDLVDETMAIEVEVNDSNENNKAKMILFAGLIVFGYYAMSVLALSVFENIPVLMLVLKAVYAVAVYKLTYGNKTN
ncbi:MAG TPA: hypothetical protein VIG45_06375 [Erysipelothrix sp.]